MVKRIKATFNFIDPKVIMSVVVSLIILGVGTFAFFVTTTQTSTSYTSISTPITTTVTTAGTNATWYDGNWNYRTLIAINPTLVNETQYDFPVLIQFKGNTTLTSKFNGTGNDIIFVNWSNNNTIIPFEIEYLDTTYGNLSAWVNITTLSSTAPTYLWMYYNNTNQSTSLSEPPKVWNQNYTAVYHMNSSTADPIIFDSTGYYNWGTKINGPTQSLISGMIGYSQTFLNTSDQYVRVYVANFTGRIVDNVTIEAQMTIPEIPGWNAPISMDGMGIVSLFDDALGGAKGWNWYQDDFLDVTRKSNIFLLCRDAAYLRMFENGSIINQSWMGAALQLWSDHNTSTNTVYTFAATEGEIPPASLPAVIAANVPMLLGGYGCSNKILTAAYLDKLLNGTLDEVRISNINRTASWLNTTANSIIQYSTFASLSPSSETNTTTTTITSTYYPTNMTDVTGSGNSVFSILGIVLIIGAILMIIGIASKFR